ncbi:immunity protein 48 of polymorphic toxin system [Paenibacillus barcinonensis]|uniref:Immunity protein 48 of polymorphic toxin system n=3 Tax=Paenibacillus barcinonensis TaxID=198119 RepID=A0A2V4W8Q9_PAEBA|nr:immunity protein 48 of polymorphic toxin system [Paenibacillus barcinonensis]
MKAFGNNNDMKDVEDNGLKNDAFLAAAASELEQMVEQICERIGTPLHETTELQRQVLAAFGFGAVYSITHRDRLTEPQAHALSIRMLIKPFNYSEQQAVDFVDDLIRVASNEEVHPLMNTIIHRGINGHVQFAQEDYEAMGRNIQEILAAVQQ